MKTFNVRITETLEKDVTIQANNETEALEIAKNNYKAAQDDYILGADDFAGADFKIADMKVI